MLFTRVARWLSVPQVERRVALLAFVCTLPSLAIGLQADDYELRNRLTADPWSAYDFTDPDREHQRARVIAERAAGREPWWVDERNQLRFFRPLSSLSLWFDFQVIRTPWLMHLQNCLWYAALVWLAGLVYRRLGLDGVGLGLSLVCFALFAPFAASAGWISSRNTLMAVCFGIACVLCHLRGRSEEPPARPRWALPAASLCFVLAILSAEIGLSALAFVVAHALVLDRGSFRTRALALAPYLFVLSLYGAHYVAGDYGASGWTFYRDLRGKPGEALFGLIESIPIYLASTAAAPFSAFYAVLPYGRTLVLLIAIPVLALLWPLMAVDGLAQPRTRFLLLGALLSIVPLAGAVPQDRLVFFVGFGIFGLVGPWIVRDFDAPSRLRRFVARSLWRIHAVWLPLTFVPMLFTCGSLLLGGGARALDRAVPHATAPTIVLLNVPSYLLSYVWREMRPPSARPAVLTLYAGPQPVEVKRIGERSLELQVDRGWMATPLERIRDLERAPFRPGDVVELPQLRVEVVAVRPDGAPQRVRFTFDRPLEDPGYRFMCWPGREIQPCPPPRAGERMSIRAAATF